MRHRNHICTPDNHPFSWTLVCQAQTARMVLTVTNIELVMILTIIIATRKESVLIQVAIWFLVHSVCQVI